jgi:class 3 adenylate cyclase
VFLKPFLAHLPSSRLIQAFYLGPADLHDPAYDSTKKVIPFYTYTDSTINDIPTHCPFVFSLYASAEFETKYKTNAPRVTSIAVTCSFLVIVLIIVTYDCHARRMKNKLINVATQTSAIVSSMYPASIRNEVMLDSRSQHLSLSKDNQEGNRIRHKCLTATIPSTKPIANLFLETTVLFADIAGFTAWSSQQQPEQVFALLETLFKAFDEIAYFHGVYKVETIGDCYVAVTGLPNPQPQHAVIMATFARDCMSRMYTVIRKLVPVLGPRTAELSMRFGLHSGPVTAGVLRGDRAQFQLFGDTVNVASCLEHTGLRDHIQVSQTTANLIMAGGKGEWLTPRVDEIVDHTNTARKTYWVATKSTS